MSATNPRTPTRLRPRLIGSGPSGSVVGWLGAVEDIDIEAIALWAELHHRPGHVGQEHQLKDCQSDQHAEPKLERDQQQPHGDDGDDPEPGQGIEGQGTALVLVLTLPHLDHRRTDQPEVERAEGQSDTGTHPDHRFAERDAPHQPRHPDNEGGCHRSARDSRNIGQREPGEHLARLPFADDDSVSGHHTYKFFRTSDTVTNTAATTPNPRPTNVQSGVLCATASIATPMPPARTRHRALATPMDRNSVIPGAERSAVSIAGAGTAVCSGLGSGDLSAMIGS